MRVRAARGVCVTVICVLCVPYGVPAAVARREKVCDGGVRGQCRHRHGVGVRWEEGEFRWALAYYRLYRKK